MTRLSITEQKVLGLFATKRNEDGRVQVWTVPECKAAHKLAARGLVRVEFCTSTSKVYRGYLFGRNGGTTVTESGYLNLWEVK